MSTKEHKQGSSMLKLWNVRFIYGGEIVDGRALAEAELRPGENIALMRGTQTPRMQGMFLLEGILVWKISLTVSARLGLIMASGLWKDTAAWEGMPNSGTGRALWLMNELKKYWPDVSENDHFIALRLKNRN